MQEKITGDVRIVFTLSIDKITGCPPKKSYLVNFKRGDKIHSTTAAATANTEGIVLVNTNRVFTSTLQRDTSYKYKKKELKIRVLELPRRTTVISLTYDLSKNIMNESFPERKLIVKGDDGSIQLFLKIEGLKESVYNDQNGIHAAATASLTSHMHEPLGISTFKKDPESNPSIASRENYSDFESVVENVLESSANESKNSFPQSSKFDTCEESLDENSDKKMEHGDFSHPTASLFNEGVPTSSAQKSFNVPGANKDLNKHVEQRPPPTVAKVKTKIPPSVPVKRMIVTSNDVNRGLIGLIIDSVRRGEDKSHFTSGASEGVQLVLKNYFSLKGEALESFVLYFVASLTLDVCRETRLFGNWLSLLIHVLYRSILQFPNNTMISDDVRKVSAQLYEISSINISDFVVKEKNTLKELTKNKEPSLALQIFWIAGLEKCSGEIISLSEWRLRQMKTEIFGTLSFPHKIHMSLEEQIVTETILFCAEVDYILSVLLPNHEVDIRHAAPVYRIIIVQVLSKIFEVLITCIINFFDTHVCSKGEKATPILRVLTTLKSWARERRLLSVVSPSLVPLIAFCDYVLLPEVMRANDNYACFMEKWLPCRKNTGIDEPGCLIDNFKELSVSAFNTLRFFTRSPDTTTKPFTEDSSNWCLLEILNGDHNEVARIITEEEIFSESGFNGLQCTFSRPEAVLPLLDASI